MQEEERLEAEQKEQETEDTTAPPSDENGETVEDNEQSEEQEGQPEGEKPESEADKKDKPWYKYRIEREKAKNAELQKRLDAIEQRVQGGQSSDRGPKPDDYLTNEEYQRAIVRHEASKLMQEQQNAQTQSYQAQQEQQRQLQEWNGKIQEFVSRSGMPQEEYARIVSSAEVELDDSKVFELMTSDYGPDIAVTLATKPDVAWKVSQMNEKQFERFLAREEAKLELKGYPTPTEKPSVSKAPAPTQTAKTVKKSSNSLDEWVANRRKEIARF